MCVLLNICKTCQATNYSSKFYSDKDNITIHRNYGKATYHVNDKIFTYDQLTDSQKKNILEMEKSLEKLEIAIDIDSEAMEKWAEKMGLIADGMEEDAEQLEDVLEDLEFYGSSFKLSEMTKKIEVKMQILKTKMKIIQINMPSIDRAKIKALGKQAEEYQNLLLEISETI